MPVGVFNVEPSKFPGFNLGGVAQSGESTFAAGTIVNKPAPAAGAIALDFSKPLTIYDRLSVTTAITFSPDPIIEPIPGAKVQIRLLADGTNTVTFSGIKQRTGSAYTNTAGILNIAEFWYDGTDYWVNVYSEAGATADATLPTLVSATYGTVTNKLILTYSESLSKNNVPAPSAFALSGNRVVNNVGVSGRKVTLTLTPAYAIGDAPTLSYTPPATNRLQDNYNNLAAALTNTPIVVSAS